MTTVQISNKTVENFLYQQTTENDISPVEYLTSLVLNEIEFIETRKEIQTLKSELQEVSKGTIKPKPAHLLLDEL